MVIEQRHPVTDQGPCSQRPEAEILGDNEPAAPTQMGCVPGTESEGNQSLGRQAGNGL